MKKFWVATGICLMLLCTLKAVYPTPPEYQIILQNLVYGGDLTLTSNTSLPYDCIFRAKTDIYQQETYIDAGVTNMSVVFDAYQTVLPIDYKIFNLKELFSVYGMIEGYSLKGQALSDTTVEVNWINREQNSNYTVEDTIGTTAITIECSNDDYCYGYITNLSAPIGDEYKTKLTSSTEPPLTTITSTTILPFTEAMEVPQLSLLTFHRTDESTMEVCFKDADPPIITDTSTADQVTFTFTINGMEQHSRTAFELKKINNTIHCASFDVTDLSEFTEAFALVGQLSVHNQDDLQMNMATIFTSFQMPGSTEIPECSSAAVWNDDDKPIAIVECRENDQLDNLTIVTASAGDPILFLQAVVNKATKIADNTTYYLDLSANVGNNTPTSLYISKEITVNPPLTGTVHVYSGPDECTLITPMENPTTEQAVVYNGRLTLTFGQPLTDNMSFIFETNDESIIQKIPKGATNVDVNLTNYVIDQDITYFIYDSPDSTIASATIKGYSLKGQSLSNTTVEVSWINHDHSEKYTVEDSISTPAITVECSYDDYCYAYFTKLPASIGEDYKATLTPPTEPLLTTTITSTIITPFTEAMEVPQLTLLTFHRTDETTMEVCFEDAEPPIISDTPTEHQVTFTFTINGMEQLSRTAKNLKKINNIFHCASFDVTGQSEFTETFSLVGQLSIHDQNDLQINIATGFTSFQMPESLEIPFCSSAAVLKDDGEPFAIAKCRENDRLDNLTIVTASEDEPISFLQAVVTTAAKIFNDTTYYLGLSDNVGSNTPTKLYISKEINVNPPLSGTVQVYSGPTDDLYVIDSIADPVTEQSVVYGGIMTLTFRQATSGNLSFAVQSGDKSATQTIPTGATNVEVDVASYVTDQDITYLIYDSVAVSAASATIKGYSLRGEALSDTIVEINWMNRDQRKKYLVEDSIGSPAMTVSCNTDEYCYTYLIVAIGEDYKAKLTPPTEPPLRTTITSTTIPPYTETTEIHIQDVHLNWSNNLRMVEMKICFQNTVPNHHTNETAFDYEGVIVNNQGEWQRVQGFGKDSEGNSCLKPLVLDTESFSMRDEMTVIVLKRSQDGRTILASGETRMYFHK